MRACRLFLFMSLPILTSSISLMCNKSKTLSGAINKPNEHKLMMRTI